MFNPVKISDSLVGIVGLQQPDDPIFAILDEENQSSRSGLYVTNNSYARIPFLMETQDYANISNEQFNTLLRNMQKASIINVCSEVFNKPAFVDRNLIYKYAGAKVETEVLPQGFVGRRLIISNEKNIAVKISRVLLDFDGTGAIELMLFNTAQKAPLYTKEIEITTDHQNEPLNWVIDNSGDTYKGEYYIGYISTGISVAPFKRDYQNSRIESAITHVETHRVFVENHVTDQLFDIRQVANMNEVDGLNLDITVYEDYTDLIIQNEMIFARAIYLDFVISFLHKYQTSVRSNRVQRLTAELVSRTVLEIEGNRGIDSPVVVQGLRPEFLREISQIKEEVDKIRSGYFGDGMYVSTLD